MVAAIQFFTCHQKSAMQSGKTRLQKHSQCLQIDKLRRTVLPLVYLVRIVMHNATVTSKGQTTIPKAVRDGLNLQPQDKLLFTLLPDGTVIMRAKTRALTELIGIADYKGPKIPLRKLKGSRLAIA
jgi:antitoxin PrlF